MQGSWSLGVLIGIPVLVIVIVIALVLAVVGLVIWSRGKEALAESRANNRGTTYRQRKAPTDGLVMSGVCLGVIVVVLGIAAWAYFPYDREYHRWEPATGTVATISSRLLQTGSGDDKSISQRFVVAFTDGRQRSCDDTRCSLVEKGDTLTVKCKRHWQFSGTDGYDCNFIDLRKANGQPAS